MNRHHRPHETAPAPASAAASLNAARRERELAELSGHAEVDVLVVGLGATGAGVALDAATRGLSVAALVAGVAALRAHPLFHKIIEVDPDVLLPYILERRGTSQDAMLRALEGTLRAGHRDGSIRKGHPARQARSMLLTLQSFAMSGHIMTGDDPALSAAAFDEELRQILERYLTP